MNKSIKKFTNKQPLADRLRPRILGDFFGQEKIIGRNTFLKRAIMNDSVPSMILWGPPGSGKTTLAHIIAHKTKADFVQLSAVASGKKDLMEVVSKAKTIKLLVRINNAAREIKKFFLVTLTFNFKLSFMNSEGLTHL